MGGLRSVIDGLNAPRASRWLLGTATVLLTAWLQAHILLAAVHDDGGTVRNAIEVYNSGEAREQVSGAIDWALQTGGDVSGASAELAPIRTAIAGILTSGQMSPPVADALVTELLAVRDEALAQFAAASPTRALTVNLAPLLVAFGIEVTPELTQALGSTSAAELTLPLMNAEAVDTLRTRYRIAEFVDRWGLIAAGAMALAGIVVSRRPLRTLAIALAIGGASCLIALPLFDAIHGWLLGGGIGPWSALVAPLVESAVAEIRPWLLPVGITAIVGAVVIGIVWVVLQRRTRGSVTRSTVAEPAR